MHPFLKYPGGKTKEIPLVQKYKPSNIDRYIEPFVGGGSIFFYLNHNSSAINDKSADLYLIYKMLKDKNLQLKKILISFDECWKKIENNDFKKCIQKYSMFCCEDFLKFYTTSLERKKKTISRLELEGNKITNDNKTEIELTARKTAFYMLIRKMYNSHDKDLEMHVACFYFLREYCYSSMFRFSKNGDFNVPYGGMSYNHKYMKNKIDYMFSEEMHNILSNTYIGNDDFEVFMDKLSLKENDFIFLDPPYDSDFSTYDNNPFDKSEQIRLRDYLKKTEAKWMLLIKKTDFISDLYSSFNIYEYDMNYMVSFKNRNNREVKHLLITNYKLEEK